MRDSLQRAGAEGTSKQIDQVWRRSLPIRGSQGWPEQPWAFLCITTKWVCEGGSVVLWVLWKLLPQQPCLAGKDVCDMWYYYQSFFLNFLAATGGGWWWNLWRNNSFFLLCFLYLLYIWLFLAVWSIFVVLLDLKEIFIFFRLYFTNLDNSTNRIFNAI